MSRYILPGKKHNHQIVVGFDNPLQTYFAQVEELQEDLNKDPKILVWVGTSYEEIADVEKICNCVSEYGNVPEYVKTRLKEDYQLRSPPAPLQTKLIKLFKNL